jgi:integrase
MRSIPINSILFQAISEYRKRRETGRPSAGDGTEDACAPRGDYLFFNDRTGKPILDTKTGFQKAVRRAGIPHIRFHDLRHTFATRLVVRGADLATVSELLGHATIEMTMRYAHPSPDVRRRAVELLCDAQKSGSAREERHARCVRSQAKIPRGGHKLDTNFQIRDQVQSAKLSSSRLVRP